MAAIRHTSQRLTLLMLVLASITVLTLDYHGEASRAIGHTRDGFSEALAPVQRGIQAALHPLGDVVSAAFHYGELQSQNEQLRNQIGALQRTLYSDGYAQQVAPLIAKLEALPWAGDVKSLPAELISLSSSNFEQTVEINQGTSSGVGQGMPVVAQAGLIGRVISASASTAQVELITQAGESVPVQDKAGAALQLAGQGPGRPLTLEAFSTTSAPQQGSMLWTRGQQNNGSEITYPPGIPVGYVSKITNGPGGTPSGSVELMADLNDLVYVAVLEWTPTA